MKPQTGFTLNELIAALAIAGTLTAIAIPSFSGLIRSNRLTTINNDVIGSLHYARSEAVKRATNVIIKPKTANQWESGWTVELTNCTEGCVIRNHDALPADYTLRGQQNDLPLNNLMLFSSGAVEYPATLVLCDTTTHNSKAITINAVGYTRTAPNSVDTASCQ